VQKIIHRFDEPHEFRLSDSVDYCKWMYVRQRIQDQRTSELILDTSELRFKFSLYFFV